MRGRMHMCKRFRGRDYEQSSCRIPNGPLAYKEDGFTNVIPFVEIRLSYSGPSPNENKKLGSTLYKCP